MFSKAGPSYSIRSTRGPTRRASRARWVTSVQTDWLVRILMLLAYLSKGPTTYLESIAFFCIRCVISMQADWFVRILTLIAYVSEILTRYKALYITLYITTNHLGNNHILLLKYYIKGETRS